MDPVAALREIAYYKDRGCEEPRRVMAYRRAADVIEALDDAQRDRLGFVDDRSEGRQEWVPPSRLKVGWTAVDIASEWCSRAHIACHV